MDEPVLGIDVGASGTKAALVDVERGVLVSERRELPTPQPATIEELSATVTDLVRPWEGMFSLAGLAFPAVVRRGVVLSAVHIPGEWLYADLGDMFAETLAAPTWAVNDSDAAAFAEAMFGAGRHEGGTLFVTTLGTGVGTSLIIERQLVPNMELGMLHVRGKPAAERVSNSVRKRKHIKWRAWAADLERFIEVVDVTVSPDLVILGGGASRRAHRFMPHLRTRPRVVPARLRNDAGIVGAAAYASDRQQRVHVPRTEVVRLPQPFAAG